MLLAINIEPSQDPSAVQLIRSHKYTFVPLKMPDPNWSERYDVHEAPTNFLLDRQGRIVLKPSFETPDAREIAEGEIRGLLKLQERERGSAGRGSPSQSAAR